MGQQQGKQGYPLPPPPMEGVAAKPPPPVSRIKGLKPRQPAKESGAWSPASQGLVSGVQGPPLGAGPPSGAILGLFNEHANGKTKVIHALQIGNCAI